MSILDSLFIEFDQYKKISDLEDKIKYVDNNSETVYKHEMLLIGLENKIEQMALLFRSLYDLGINKELFTKDEFRNIFDKIDLEDGIKDRKITRKK
jgi:hypothetical protein